MEITQELLDLLADEPSRIADYPNAPVELHLHFVRQDPWNIQYIDDRHPEVILESYRGEYSLIGNNPNPTEAEQVAAAQGSFMAFQYIKNPCRAACLVILEEYGTFFDRLNELQEELGTALAATKLRLTDDAELQAAALSNITGLYLYQRSPHLFNRVLLDEQYPGLLTVADTLLALGMDSNEFEEIQYELKAAKEKVIKVQLPNIVVPTDVSM